MTRSGLLYRLTLFLALWLPLVASAGAITGVGIAPIKIPDPVSGETTDGFVFYPSATPVGKLNQIGPYDVSANFGTPALPGAKPLVVISHGNGGSRLGHHDMATYLASRGFIVATLNHPKDDFEDTSGVGHIEVLAGRPAQVRATISMLLADPRWQKLIDPNRVGVAGFSAGGYTSLMVVGAMPRFDRFVSYCEAHADDANICGKVGELRAEAAKSGRSLLQYAQGMQAELDKYGPTADPRVKAAFVMAPLSLIFDEHAFDKVTAPIYLYYGQHDSVLKPAFNARHIQPLIKQLYAVKEIPNADHWVFLVPCTPDLIKDIPVLCADPKGVDRVQWHDQINEDAFNFFRKTLKVEAH